MLKIDSKPDSQKVLNALKWLGNEFHAAGHLNRTNNEFSHCTSLDQFNREQGEGGQKTDQWTQKMLCY